MSVHSPGPWTADSESGEWFIDDADLELVADCYVVHHGLRSPETLEANAHLIAAAPDLLEALKQALFVMESVAETHGYDTSIGSVPQARAAIAKAEGRS